MMCVWVSHVYGINNMINTSTQFPQETITHKLNARDQKDRKKKKGCYLHSSSSTVWCQCPHSRARCNLAGGWQAVNLEKHLDSITTEHL